LLGGNLKKNAGLSVGLSATSLALAGVASVMPDRKA